MGPPGARRADGRQWACGNVQGTRPETGGRISGRAHRPGPDGRRARSGPRVRLDAYRPTEWMRAMRWLCAGLDAQAEVGVSRAADGGRWAGPWADHAAALRSP